MKAYLQKRWVRVLSAVLFVVFLASALFSAAIVQYARDDRWYRLQGNSMSSFAETNQCRNYVCPGTWFVYENVMWLGDLTLDYLGTYAGSAFSYCIEDASGAVLVDTTTPSSHPVDVATVTTNDYVTVRGYINLPVEPYGGCYVEYMVFEIFFGIRYLMIALMILFFLLSLALLAGAVYSCVCLGREGKLNWLWRLPVDGTALACAIAAAVLNRGAEELINRFIISLFAVSDYYSILGTLYTYMSWFFWLLAIALVVCLAAGQLGGGIFYQRLLVRQGDGLWLVIAVFSIRCVLAYNYIKYYTGWYLVKPFIALDVLILAGVVWFCLEARTIKKSFHALSGGDLSYKTRTNRLHFIWRTLGEELNSISEGMAEAVDERMRSERMKTELITNVSHDIRTPLTSIINYVDLLKNGNLDEETRREYLGILEKQSARLKQLTEDVIEASKAASGALTVSNEPIDAVELLEQFVGEYASRLAAADLSPVLTAPDGECGVLADSVLLGRVLDNLFSNAVKYAQPGTRVYIDLVRSGEGITLAMKNTSREPLNISVDELMERFVRGDRSRHTDGSGLGLSIARSLTELMGGRLTLTLDGDLFKAEIALPCLTA